jgi:hypothetical protein
MTDLIEVRTKKPISDPTAYFDRRLPVTGSAGVELQASFFGSMHFWQMSLSASGSKRPSVRVQFQHPIHKPT